MITRAIKSQVDKVWDAFWSRGISNPLEVIEQSRRGLLSETALEAWMSSLLT